MFTVDLFVKQTFRINEFVYLLISLITFSYWSLRSKIWSGSYPIWIQRTERFLTIPHTIRSLLFLHRSLWLSRLLYIYIYIYWSLYIIFNSNFWYKRRFWNGLAAGVFLTLQCHQTTTMNLLAIATYFLRTPLMEVLTVVGTVLAPQSKIWLIISICNSWFIRISVMITCAMISIIYYYFYYNFYYVPVNNIILFFSVF